jgi:plasmid stabilization system protein ParE
MKILYSDEATRNLVGIRAYLDERSPDSGRRVVAHIMGTIARQLTWRAIGRATDITGVRVLVLTRYPFKIFYEKQKTAVIILRIRHDRQE